MKECKLGYHSNWAMLCTLDGKVCPNDNENCKDFKPVRFPSEEKRI